MTAPRHPGDGPKTLPENYFDDVYRDTDDPWGFTDRWYEQRKYALTLASLTAPRYRRIFEPGCSIGVLSAALADRSEEIACIDVSARAVELAVRRLATTDARVSVSTGDLTGPWPPGTFDLIVLSEVLYYLGDADLDAVVERLPGALTDDGEVIAVHWRWPVADYPQSGDAVHERLLHSPLLHYSGYRDRDLCLDVFHRGPRDSVAQREGLTPG